MNWLARHTKLRTFAATDNDASGGAGRCRRSRTDRALRAVQLVLIAACLSCGGSGCVFNAMPAPPPYRVVLGPGYNPKVQHRLLFMPIVGLEGDPVATKLVTDALVNELRTVGPFEVVMAAPPLCPDCAPPPPPFPTEAELAALVARHRPDAFVFVTVASYSPYPPLELGLSVRVVSAIDRQTLASIDTVRYAAQDIPFSNGDCTFAHEADDLLLADAAIAGSSPRLFARHVAMHVAHALALDPLPLEPTVSSWSILPKLGQSPESCERSPRSPAAPR
jgi:hypothetical protein